MLEDQCYHCHYRLPLLLKITIADFGVNTAGAKSCQCLHNVTGIQGIWGYKTRIVEEWLVESFKIPFCNDVALLVVDLSGGRGDFFGGNNVHSPKDLQHQGCSLLSCFGIFLSFYNNFHISTRKSYAEKGGAADVYKLSAYSMTRITSDLPLDLLLPLLFLLIVYYKVGLRATVESFFLTMLILFLCVVVAQHTINNRHKYNYNDGDLDWLWVVTYVLGNATSLAFVTVMTFMLEAKVAERGSWSDELWEWECGWRELKGRELGEHEELQSFLQWSWENSKINRN
ncbi:hypothetical protein OSB04_009599 [Centaurea solstitialis]|uniref:ABC-2 type transporter transmembrane domain-containing protein n=1 Tax=Centaurea solstitialis TaxID=347529 RepID=A0AA38T5X7_9ASTR|nr:hypothetical protein OSB04_009599 [Centaurea solstitialis]